MLKPVPCRAPSPRTPRAWALLAALALGCGPSLPDDGLDPSQVDRDGDGYASTDIGGDDCNDNNYQIYPGAAELENGRDDDCDALIDEDTDAFDDDGDGFSEAEGDDDDADPTTFPGAEEHADGKDNDQDGRIDEGTPEGDGDGDGFSPADGDQDDSDPDTYPGAEERADGKDNDQDGRVDEGTATSDDDGDGASEDEGDCDDADPARAPDLPEACDAQDNDCDDAIDEGGVCRTDDDGDGSAAESGDCDDGDAAIFPGQTEAINGQDDDCDDVVDEGTTAFDDDGDGYSEAEGDCNDRTGRIHPGAPEYSGGLPDGIDNDCDGAVDEVSPGVDLDGDGYSDEIDCDDSNPDTYPGALEIEDGRDNDCDGMVDESGPISDDDGDGYSNSMGDCDDQDPTIYPGAEEACDGVDNDCSGLADEPCVPCAVPGTHDTIPEALAAGCREIRLSGASPGPLVITDPPSDLALVGGAAAPALSSITLTLTSGQGEARTVRLQDLTLTGALVVTNGDPLAQIELVRLKMEAVEAAPAPMTLSGPNLSVLDCAFLGNVAGGSADAAGALRLKDAAGFALVGNRFEGNEAPRYVDDVAGAVYIGGASTGRIDNNLFLDNRASGRNAGGALFLEPEVQGALLIRNNTFAYNANAAEPSASSLRCQGTLSGGILDSNIHWYEAGTHLAGCELASVSYSTLQSLGTHTGSGNISQAPAFDDLEAFTLGAASPARDAGSPDDDRRDLDGSRNDQGHTGGPDGAH